LRRSAETWMRPQRSGPLQIAEVDRLTLHNEGEILFGEREIERVVVDVDLCHIGGSRQVECRAERFVEQRNAQSLDLGRPLQEVEVVAGIEVQIGVVRKLRIRQAELELEFNVAVSIGVEGTRIRERRRSQQAEVEQIVVLEPDVGLDTVGGESELLQEVESCEQIEVEELEVPLRPRSEDEDPMNRREPESLRFRCSNPIT